MPFHQDNEDCLDDQPIIFSLSVGESKNLVVKHATDPQKSVQFQMSSGTLLIMLGKVNSNWIHGVPTKCKNERINLTFRLINSNHQTLDTILSELRDLKVEITDIKRQLADKENKISQLQNQLSLKHQPSHHNVTNEVVILKSQIMEGSPETCTAHINSCLPKDGIHATDIDSIQDHRPNKGPIVIRFKSVRAKVIALKASCKLFVIKNALPKEKLFLRKEALKLREMGLIQKVWDYRGEIYFKRPDHEEKVCAGIEDINAIKANHDIPLSVHK